MARTLIASDAFTNTDGTALTAHGGNNWQAIVQAPGSINAGINANRVVALLSTGVPDFPAYRWAGAGTFTNDQYAQASLQSLSWQTSAYRAGVAVRVSADTAALADYYAWWVVDDSNTARTTKLGKVVNGTATELDSRSVAWVNGDVMTLEAIGTTLNCYRNGELLFSVSDASLSTGTPGLVIKGGSNVPALDDWQGGNATAGAAGPNISTQPSAQTVTVGAAATFAVVATASGGGALAYQWRANGANISGATGASYTRTAALGDNGLQISVLVAESGGSNPGSVVSANALLSVNSGVVYGFDLHTLAGCRLTSFAAGASALSSEAGARVVVVAMDPTTDAEVARSSTLTADSSSRLPRWAHPALTGPGTTYDVKFKPADGRAPYIRRLSTT